MADWKLQADSGQRLYFDCHIDAGYIKKDESFVFVPKPTMQPVNVSVEVSVCSAIHCHSLCVNVDYPALTKRITKSLGRSRGN